MTELLNGLLTIVFETYTTKTLPQKIIAKNTIKSMQAGTVFGYIGLTEYIIQKIKEEYGQDLKVISTGGLGRIIANETDKIDVYDIDLTFKGLKIIYEKTKKNLYEKRDR